MIAKKNNRTENRWTKAAVFISSSAAVACWVILEYLGILEFERLGRAVEDCYAAWTKNEVNS